MSELSQMVKGCTFDDFIYTPQESVIRSRDPSNINLNGHLTRKIILKRPIISSNMDTITRAEMAILMAEEGGIGIIDRGFRDGIIEPQVNEVIKVKRAQHGIIKDPMTIPPKATLGEAKAVMRKYKIGSLLVMDMFGTLVGIITKRDIRFCNYDTEKVTDRMVGIKDLVFGNKDMSLEEAEKLMRNTRIKQIPLIDEEHKIHGLITSRDLIRHKKLTFATTDSNKRLMVGAAIGAVGDYLERAHELIKAGADVIVIDIAHGHSVVMKNAIDNFRKKFGDFEIIGGNVGTKEGAKALFDWGVDGIKVGIGPGSACTTRSTTNFGVPQAQAIYDSCSAVPSVEMGGVPLIADGGIKRDGHLVQAYLLGAQTVMVGGVFAGADETPGSIIKRKVKIDGMDMEIRLKLYRGMASLGAIKDRLDIEDADIIDDDVGAEGMEKAMPLRGSARVILRNMIRHLCSSISYGGASSLQELRQLFNQCPSKFLIKLSQSSRDESYKR